MAQTQKKQQDMGTGDVKKLLLQLMIPAVVAQVVNLLYNIVDRIYIGHISGIGAAALTGVGLFTPILMLLNEKYGLTEEDFLSAELEIVPAGKAYFYIGNVTELRRSSEKEGFPGGES